VPPFQEENVVDTVTGDLVKGAPEGAILLKPAKGLHRVGSNGEALPIFPFGFYQYGIDQDLEKALPSDEVIHGMSLTAPYASTAAPSQQWFSDMTSFLDRCHQIGFQVHFQLIAFESLPNDSATLANLTTQIERFKSHPALFAWYLADEPDGQGIAPDLLAPKYALIKKLDPYHPVSMVFCAGGASRYLSYLDLIMVDPYPIPNAAASSVQSSLEQVGALGKPIMLVPQAFGGGENWARGPSVQEERLMTYLGWLNGAVAIQYFVRSPPSVFPYAPAAWSEIRKIAAESVALTSALAGGSKLPCSVAGTTNVAAGAWKDRDGSVVVVVAHNGTGVLGTSEQFSIQLVDTIWKVPGVTVTSIFENLQTTFDAEAQTISDGLRPKETRVYRISSSPSVDPTNLVYNPSYETTVNPAVPDGNYLAQADDLAATFFADSRLSVDGRNSLCLTAPSKNSLTLSPYTIPKLKQNATYSFSVWVKGDRGGEMVGFKFNPNILAVKTTNHSNLAVVDSNVFTVTATTKWMQYKAVLVAGPPSACPYGCRSWMAYSLTTSEPAGRVWIDVLSLTAS